MVGVEVDVGEQAIMLRRGVLGKLPRQRSQLADEELEVDLELLAGARSLPPGLGLRDPRDLLGEPHPAVAEQLAKAHEAVDLVEVHGLAVGHPPQALHVERQARIVARGAAPVDPQLAQVEQHAVIEVALIDVGADLTLVLSEFLCRALGVQHEAVSHEIDRCEVGFEAAAPELGEVGIGREFEHALDDGGEDRLGEHFLVLTGSWPREVVAQVPAAVEPAVPACLLVEERRKPSELCRDRRHRHQNAAESVKTSPRSGRASEAAATVRRVTPASSPTDLTAAELEALRSAGAWYAKYHVVRVAELADDPSAYAESRRDKFLALVSALRKLGFEMALPDALRSDERQAA